MTKKQLTEIIGKRKNLKPSFVREIVDEYEEVIKDAVSSGETVQFYDFLTFKIDVTGGCYGYSWRAKGPVFRRYRYKLSVKPTGKFKDSVEKQEVSVLDKRKRDAELEKKYHKTKRKE